MGKGTTHFNTFDVKARSKIFNSLTSLTKSPGILILQCTILMLEWRNEEPFHRWNQFFSFIIHLIMCAKHETDHFCYEVSGKRSEEVKITYKKVTSKFLINIIQIFIRTSIYA